MKRFFILATAAIVALASCAKTEIVYKDAPEEIAFRQITNVMTKADPTPYEEGSLGVLANQGTDVYFGNTSFGWDDTENAFKASTPQYWPNSGYLDFTVYAPAGNASLSADCKTLTITGVTAAEKLYYGVQRYVGLEDPSGAVAVELKHASAKINIILSGSTLFKVTDLTIDGVSTTGNVVVTYSATTPYSATDVETNGGNSATLDFVSSPVELTSADQNCDPLYVLPGAQKKITIKYQQKHANGTDWLAEVTKTIALTGDWDANTAYTYDISIETNEIKFTAKVHDWENEPTVEKDQDDFVDAI